MYVCIYIYISTVWIAKWHPGGYSIYPIVLWKHRVSSLKLLHLYGLRSCACFCRESLWPHVPFCIGFSLNVLVVHRKNMWFTLTSVFGSQDGVDMAIWHWPPTQSPNSQISEPLKPGALEDIFGAGKWSLKIHCSQRSITPWSWVIPPKPFLCLDFLKINPLVI